MFVAFSEKLNFTKKIGPPILSCQSKLVKQRFQNLRLGPNISTTPITAMGFLAMFTFNLDNTKR